MVKKKEKIEKVEISCADKFCPWHGKEKLKMRGRVFEGVVIRKFPKRVVIQFERMFKLRKYERYEKRRTKIHARLTDCLRDKVEIGDLVRVAETRPISKMICFVVCEVKKINGEGGR